MCGHWIRTVFRNEAIKQHFLILFPRRPNVGTKEKSWKRKRNVAWDLKSISGSPLCPTQDDLCLCHFLNVCTISSWRCLSNGVAWISSGNLFQTFYSYRLTCIYNLSHSFFCKNQPLMPQKCQAEQRGNFVCPADDNPVYKILYDTCKILKSNPILFVFSSSVLSSASVVSSFSIQDSRSWVKSVSGSRSNIDTYKTSFIISFQSSCEPGYIVAECISLGWTCTSFINTLACLWKCCVNQGQERNKIKVYYCYCLSANYKAC